MEDMDPAEDTVKPAAGAGAAGVAGAGRRGSWSRWSHRPGGRTLRRSQGREPYRRRGDCTEMQYYSA